MIALQENPRAPLEQQRAKSAYLANLSLIASAKTAQAGNTRTKKRLGIANNARSGNTKLKTDKRPAEIAHTASIKKIKRKLVVKHANLADTKTTQVVLEAVKVLNA